jgi:diketogulonate reductase-like aldo/keto reductase
MYMYTYTTLGPLFLCTRAEDADPIVFEEPLLKEIAQKKNKTIAQVG